MLKGVRKQYRFLVYQINIAFMYNTGGQTMKISELNNYLTEYVADEDIKSLLIDGKWE